MYYEINISKKVNGQYVHHFATSPRSAETKEKAKVLIKELAEKFPEPEYKIYVVLNMEQSFRVKIEELLL